MRDGQKQEEMEMYLFGDVAKSVSPGTSAERW
jgi:hypothetical protein